MCVYECTCDGTGCVSFNTVAVRTEENGLWGELVWSRSTGDLSTTQLTQPVGGTVRPGTQLSRLSPDTSDGRCAFDQENGGGRAGLSASEDQVRPVQEGISIS